MVVCFCAETKEQDVESALDAGAASLCQIENRCGAGRDCGMCHETLLAMLTRRSCHQGASAARLSPAALPRGESRLERSL
jgi:bacterioferritin-associated ferredoxin